MSAKSFGFAIAFCAVALFMSGVAHAGSLPVIPHAATAAPAVQERSSVEVPSQQAAVTPTYVLGPGDHIRLTVYGEEDLSGEYEVGSTGTVALPLIGSIQAAGYNLRQFEQAVGQKLAQGYLRDPRVNVQVMNYRPFFILGEVSKPGSYPFVNGMTVLNAIALAGGYTYRGSSGNLTIVHASDPVKKEVSVTEDQSVMPGDIIRVPERFF